MEIAIFGTSADPPTLSHQKILTYLAEHYDLALVYASNNPFKAHLSDLKHRSKMLELVITELDKQGNNILLAPQISDRYTINTVTKVKNEWGEGHILTMVIGGDLSEQIFSWHQAQELWQSVKVLIVPRNGYPIRKEVVDKIDRQSLGCSVTSWQIPPFSSTDYRCHRNQKVLTNSVQLYIEEHNLYFHEQQTGGN